MKEGTKGNGKIDYINVRSQTRNIYFPHLAAGHFVQGFEKSHLKGKGIVVWLALKWHQQVTRAGLKAVMIQRDDTLRR